MARIRVSRNRTGLCRSRTQAAVSMEAPRLDSRGSSIPCTSLREKSDQMVDPQSLIDLMEELTEGHGMASGSRGVMTLRIVEWMAMPPPTQLIPTIEPLALIDERKVRGVEDLIAIDLDEEIRTDIASGFHDCGTGGEHLDPTIVGIRE